MEFKKSTDNLLDQIHPHLSPLLFGQLQRALRQEKAASWIGAVEATASPTLEALAEQLRYSMASMLDSALVDETLDPENFVKNNDETLMLIARHAAKTFANLNPQAAVEAKIEDKPAKTTVSWGVVYETEPGGDPQVASFITSAESGVQDVMTDYTAQTGYNVLHAALQEPGRGAFEIFEDWKLINAKDSEDDLTFSIS